MTDAASPPAEPVTLHGGALKRIARSGGSGAMEIFGVLGRYLRVDRYLTVIIVVFLAILGPHAFRNTENPQRMAAYVNDEPFLTMALEAMTIPPYGNPGNFFQEKNLDKLPEHWGHLSYLNITYYGGAMYAVAYPPFLAAKAFGAPTFPVAPIILRLVSMLASLMSLMVLYNIGRERGYRIAGALGGLYLLADTNWQYYTNYIHPDTLQALFGLFALVFAAAHAKKGSIGTLAGLGIMCGLVQGAKSGGPWTVPLAGAALLIGLFTAVPPGGRLAKFLKRSAILGMCASGAFIISTPYIILDSYYLKSMLAQIGIVTTDSLQQAVSFETWFKALSAYLGMIPMLLLVPVIVRGGVTAARGFKDPLLFLALVLAASQFVWYAMTGKLWVMVGYLVLSIGICAVLAFESALMGWRWLLDRTFTLAKPFARVQPAVWATSMVVLSVWCFAKWTPPFAYTVSELGFSGRSTVLAANRWAIDSGINSDAVILFDDLAYFDPKRFPNARMNGGLLTWSSVDMLNPDYVVLSSNLYKADWVANLIQTQNVERQAAIPQNVRLYQDLLVETPDGSTKATGVTLVKTISPKSSAEWLSEGVSRGLLMSRWTNSCNIGGSKPLFDICSGWASFLRPAVANIARTEASYALDHGPDAPPLVGPELRIFYFDRSLLPSSFAEGTAEGYKPTFAFDGTNGAWACNATGEASKRCYVARGLGPPTMIRSADVKWVYGAAAPSEIRFEFSEDGKIWTADSVHEVRAYPASEPNFRVDHFKLTTKEPHRFWRMMVESTLPDRAYAIAELDLRETE